MRMIIAFMMAPGLATSALAQDYLGTHLETMLEHNLRQHQQQAANGTQNKKSSASPSASTPSAVEARAQLRERHKRELEPRYWMRVERDGKAEADAWLAVEARRLGLLD